MYIPPFPEEDLFARAIELPREDREAFLRTACGDDDRLREGVEELLATHDSRPAFVDRPWVKGKADALRTILDDLFRGHRGGRKPD